MNLLVALLLSAVQFHVSDRVESLRLLLKDQNGAVVREVMAAEAGDYVVENIEPGQYTLQAIAQNQLLTTITDIQVPTEKDIVVKIDLSKAAKNAEAQPNVGPQRNLNIVINLIANFNLALVRSFLFQEYRNVAVTFRAEALNLTNHPQFDAPQFYVAAPSFGRITNTLNSGRVLQFVLGVKF